MSKESKDEARFVMQTCEDSKEKSYLLPKCCGMPMMEVNGLVTMFLYCVKCGDWKG